MATSRPGGRGRTLLSVASGLLLVAGIVVLLWVVLSQVDDPPAPEADASRPPVATTGSAGPTDGPATQDAPAPSTTPGTPSTVPPESSTAAPESSALPPSDPVAVRIPSIDVASPLHPLGLDDDGTLLVPSGERYDEAAWYEGSPTPGEVGPTVIEGHVTSQGSVPSIFYDLGALRPGDLVEVDREDGRTVTFEVYGTESFPKDAFPKVTVYGNTEGPELRLITCGGLYDPDRGAHVDNIVVFARWVPGA